MKKQFLKTNSVRVYVVAIATTLLLSASFTTLNASEKNLSSSETKITYAGTTNSLMSFNIKFKNEGEAPFVLQLSDDMGNILYQEKSSLKDFDKTILLKHIGENMQVSFTIRSGKKVIAQKFDINTKVTEVEELEVTRL